MVTIVIAVVGVMLVLVVTMVMAVVGVMVAAFCSCTVTGREGYRSVLHPVTALPFIP